ncbi:MAG: hypothetical protein U9N73_08605 [Candidatus Auribacterota bacterium]|nr:hypothetical protein [Candidatus Auribacterota bacterium]
MKKEAILKEVRVTAGTVWGMMDLNPQQIICLDNAFGRNDQFKTNTVLEMRDHEIEFLVMDIKPITPRIIFSKSYQESIAIPESTAEALVEGWNEGLRNILDAFTEDIPEPKEEGENPVTD